jgi:hypothetical protein
MANFELTVHEQDKVAKPRNTDEPTGILSLGNHSLEAVRAVGSRIPSTTSLALEIPPLLPVKQPSTSEIPPIPSKQQPAAEKAQVIGDAQKIAKPAEAAQLKDAAQKEELDRIKLKVDLQDRFKVTIQEEGTTENYRGEKVKVRRLTKDELEACKQALTKAEPAQMIDKEKGVTISFLEGKVEKEWDVWPVAFNDHGRIVINPYPKNHDVLENDNKPGIAGTYGNCLSDRLKHELAHTPDMKPDFDRFDNDKTGEVAKRYGYRTIVDKTNGDRSIWVQEGTDGHLYKPLPDKDGFEVWLQCDQDGRPCLDDKGEQISKTPNELGDVALVPAVTHYSTDPYEKKAEAMACLYRGGIARAYLCAYNPKLYKLAVEDDQKMIDEIKGPGQFIRNPAGGLMANTRENQAIVREAEKNAAALAKPFEKFRGVA